MLPGFVEYVEYKPGYVYLLYHFEKLVYIGSTVNLRGRINNHRKNTKLVFNRVYYKCLGFEDARELEAKLIHDLQPSENIVGKIKIVIPGFKPINLAALGITIRGTETPIRRV